MKFNFTSQVCTSRSQSERLLALGLKKETADMAYEYKPKHLADTDIDKDWVIVAHSPCGTDIPAWSLHRLIEMCPLIPNPSRFLAVTSFKTVYVRMNDEMDVCYAGKGTYNNLINCIEWLIKEGYFNKEYLEE